MRDGYLTAWRAGQMILDDKARRGFSREYDSWVKTQDVTFTHLQKIGRWDGPQVWRQGGNLSKSNAFFWSYWAYNTDIKTEWVKGAYDSIRFGGSAWDAFRSLKCFDHPQRHVPMDELRRDMPDFLSFLGLTRGCVCPMSPDDYANEVSVKTSANAGPSFQRMGMRVKGDSLRVAFQMLRDTLSGERSVESLPPVLFGLGGRARYMKADKMEERLGDGRPIGRPVWMADTHEAVIGWRFAKPLSSYFSALQKVIMLGYNKFSEADREQFLAPFREGNAAITGDFSDFDSSVPQCLSRFAFMVFKEAFGPNLSSVDKELLEFSEEQFCRPRIVCPDGNVWRADGGVPSGSAFTSVIDSIVNAYVLWKAYGDFFKKYSNGDERMVALKVYGDDNTSSLHLGKHGHKWRYARTCRIRDHVADYCESRYGMLLKRSNGDISVDPFVKILIMKTDEEVPDHSRRYLRNHKFYSRRKDEYVLAEGKDKFRFVRDPAEAYATLDRAKRFNYHFSGAMKFLGVSYLSDGSPIRPKPDMVAMLANPDSEIDSVWRYRAVLQAYLLEHWNNLASRAELTAMWLDSLWMEDQGILFPDDARGDCLLSEKGRKSKLRQWLKKKRFKRKPSSDYTGRQWWMTQANWWPDVFDVRESHHKPQVRSLLRLTGGFESGDADMDELMGPLRPMMLLERKGPSLKPSKKTAHCSGPFMEAWFGALGTSGPLGEAQSGFSWEVSETEASESRVLRSWFDNASCYGGRPPDVSKAPPLFIPDMWIYIQHGLLLVREKGVLTCGLDMAIV